MQKHHKHSHYINRNSEIVGLAPAERAPRRGDLPLPRKATRTRGPPGVRDASQEGQATVWSLAAILRIADALDRSNLGHPDRSLPGSRTGRLQIGR